MDWQSNPGFCPVIPGTKVDVIYANGNEAHGVHAGLGRDDIEEVFDVRPSNIAKRWHHCPVNGASKIAQWRLSDSSDIGRLIANIGIVLSASDVAAPTMLHHCDHDDVVVSIQTEKETTMQFTAQYNLNGQNVANMNDAQIYAAISDAEAEIARLKSIKAKPASLKAKIADIESNLVALVEHLDSRD